MDRQNDDWKFFLHFEICICIQSVDLMIIIKSTLSGKTLQDLFNWF